MKKIFLPPLAPVVLLVAFFLFAAVATMVSGPSMIDGHADNAPYRAVLFLPIVAPMSYLFFVLVNSIDLLVERVAPRLPWFSTITVTLALSALVFKGFFRPELNNVQYFGPVALGVLIGTTVAIVPMSVWRKRIEINKAAEQSTAPLPRAPQTGHSEGAR